MADSDPTRKELLEELRRVRQRLEQLEKEREASRKEQESPSGPTRRDVLKAAWASPILLSIGLPRGAAAQSQTSTTFSPSSTTTEVVPTMRPTRAPTRNPTMRPTEMPTRTPTMRPTMRPTRTPTMRPTMRPTRTPTMRPTTRRPTSRPTQRPTVAPTAPTVQAPPSVPVIPLLNPDRK
jgi:hypothetical protein